MRFDVGDVLHAGLDSLRHELRLFLRGDKVRECRADSFAVPVVGDEIAFPPLDSDR